MSDQKIEFTLRLTEEDWDEDMGAWRCPAFDIPSSEAKEAYSKRQRLAASMFKVEKGPARLSWLGGKHPDQIVVIVQLGEKLTSTSAEEWWKRFAIIVPIITAVIAAVATYYSKPSPTSHPSSSPTQHTLRLRVDPNDSDGSGLPPAKITINSQEMKQPVEHKVASDVTAIIDVNRAYAAVRACSTAADNSIKNLNAIANQINEFTLRVTGGICSGGSNGKPAQAAPEFATTGTALQNQVRGLASEISKSQARFSQ